MSAEGGDRSGTKQRLCSRKEALRQTHSGNYFFFRGIRVRYSRFLFFFSARGSAERPRNKERGASGGGRETEGNILSLALFQKASVDDRPTASFLSLCTVKSHTLTHWIAVAAVAFALCPCSSPSLAVAAAGCVFGVRSPAALMKLCPMRTNNPTELW